MTTTTMSKYIIQCSVMGLSLVMEIVLTYFRPVGLSGDGGCLCCNLHCGLPEN